MYDLKIEFLNIERSPKVIDIPNIENYTHEYNLYK